MRDEQYRSLVRDQLIDGRWRAAATMRETLRNDTLTANEADAWLRALNDLRLVLGTRLDVTEDLALVVVFAPRYESRAGRV